MGKSKTALSSVTHFLFALANNYGLVRAVFACSICMHLTLTYIIYTSGVLEQSKNPERTFLPVKSTRNII